MSEELEQVARMRIHTRYAQIFKDKAHIESLIRYATEIREVEHRELYDPMRIIAENIVDIVGELVEKKDALERVRDAYQRAKIDVAKELLRLERLCNSFEALIEAKVDQKWFEEIAKEQIIDT